MDSEGRQFPSDKYWRNRGVETGVFTQTAGNRSNATRPALHNRRSGNQTYRPGQRRTESQRHIHSQQRSEGFLQVNQNSANINSLAFDSTVKLEEGINHIEIVARESKDLYSVKTIVVFRKKSADTATAEAERSHLDMAD